MSSLFGLNDDVLRAVLARTCGSDLLNLCLTCSRFNNIVNSAAFCQERCEMGAAEITIKIPSPFELYQSRNDDEQVSRDDEWFLENYNDFGRRDPDFGHEENEARIYIDGKLAGKASFMLLPRSHRGINFHEMCDAISDDLRETGCAFFDRNGRLRVKAVKEAMSTDDKKPLLYIQSFDLLEPECRTTSTTGARALRKLLEDPKLKDKWSVAVYIPDPRSQYNDDDRTKERSFILMERERRMMDCDDAEEEGEKSQAEREWQERKDGLTIRDMRQFFQANFLQAKELVMDHNCFFVFAVPDFLETPMLSCDETMSMSVAEKPKPRENTADEKKLLKIMVKECTTWKQLDDSIRQFMLPKEDQPIYRHVREQTAENGARIQAMIDGVRDSMEKAQERKQMLITMLSMPRIEEAKDLWNSYVNSDEELAQRFNGRSMQDGIQECSRDIDQSLATLQRQLDTVVEMQEEIERIINETYQTSIDSQLARLRQEVEETDARVRSKIAELVERAGDDVIKNSNAVHAAACNLVPAYIDLLMEFVPQAKKRQVINSLDAHGEPPLNIAAMSRAYSCRNGELRFQTCKKIIDLGGDKNFVDSNGLTALGKFRQGNRGARDFWATIGGMSTDRNPNYAAQLETEVRLTDLLRPTLGPTSADDAVRDDLVGEASDDDDEAEDDEGEDVDEDGNENDE